MTLRARALEILRTKAVLRFDDPVELASGAMSNLFVDVKAGLAAASDLTVVCSALVELVAAEGIEYQAVGGPTMGADHLAVGMALHTNSSWFFVRSAPKGRGPGRQIEGATLGCSDYVVVVEDVVSTGTSVLEAIDVVEATGATVAAVTTPLDRGTTASAAMAQRELRYFPLATAADLDIPTLD